MKVLIVDDEPLARTRLKMQLSSIGGYEFLGEAGNGLDAIDKAELLKADILLLDIRMPDMNGIEVGKYFAGKDNPPAIIFTTAYSEHALQAFESHAVAYLLKPVHRDKLEAALLSACKLTRAQADGISRSDGVKEEIGSARKQICARIRGNLRLIDLADIYYFRADSKYVEVYYEGGQVLIEESLASLEQEFETEFIRIHRNALVAKSRITSLEKDGEGRGHVLVIDTEDRIVISRRHLPAVRALFRDQDYPQLSAR